MAFEQEEKRKREQVRAGVQWLNSRVMPELLKAKEAFRKNRVELVIHQHYDVECTVEARPHIAAWCQEVHTGSSAGRATNVFFVDSDGKTYRTGFGNMLSLGRPEKWSEPKSVVGDVDFVEEVLRNAVTRLAENFFVAPR